MQMNNVSLSEYFLLQNSGFNSLVIFLNPTSFQVKIIHPWYTLMEKAANKHENLSP